jgi:hypothetical protein
MKTCSATERKILESRLQVHASKPGTDLTARTGMSITPCLVLLSLSFIGRHELEEDDTNVADTVKYVICMYSLVYQIDMDSDSKGR